LLKCVFSTRRIYGKWYTNKANCPQSIPQKRVVNTVKKDNGIRKVKRIAHAFAETVEEMDDPRVLEPTYPLDEILFVTPVVVICGSESYPDFETFGNTQLKWLKKFFFSFEEGIP